MNIDKLIASIPAKDKMWRDDMRANAERILRGNDEARKPDAQRLLDALSAGESEERERRLAWAAGLSPVERIIAAFSAEPMTEVERKVVQCLLDNPGLSSAALTEKLGWGGQIWHTFFGELCRDRMADLWPAPRAEKRKADFYCGILADQSRETNLFTMKPEAVEAFARLGLHAKRNQQP
jgi:hypothetical protein